MKEVINWLYDKTKTENCANDMNKNDRPEQDERHPVGLEE